MAFASQFYGHSLRRNGKNDAKKEEEEEAMACVRTQSKDIKRKTNGQTKQLTN